MKAIVAGCRGQLGRAVMAEGIARGWDVGGFDLPELDITDARALRRAILEAAPQFVVNCAAFTAVDGAELEEDRALAINGTAVAELARLADEAGAVLVQLSTDYVFDGAKSRPYREDDVPRPLSAYGRTKLAGEEAAATASRHLIVRTAWLFGDGGSNFVEAIRRQVDSGARVLRVVADQHGCPTYAEDLATAVIALVEVGASGIVHAVNAGAASWYGFAREIASILGKEVEVVPITTAEAARRAVRPAYSVLDTSRLQGLLGASLPSWQDALRRYLGRTLAAQA